MAIFLLVCAFLVSPGLFNIDEYVLLAGAKAFLSTGSLSIPNGWPEFSSSNLTIGLFVMGPHGLAPQYPVGPSVLGAPLYAIFGSRGLMLINVFSAIGTLFALWSLASKHFGGKVVALVSVLLLLGASFWLEYAFGIWPHAVGTLAKTLAFLLVLDCLDEESRFEATAALAGAVIGAGLLFRMGSILTLPAIGLILIVFARRPWRKMIFVGLGLLPFLVTTVAANYVKFGTLNPLSYGRTDTGATTLSSHVAPIVALALVSLLLLVVRFTGWRPKRRDYAIGLGCLVLALALSTAVRDFVLQYLAGLWALGVDATTVHDPRPGVQPLAGGIVSFWGLWKKALGQSMPWLGLLFLTVHARKDDQLRRAQWCVLILAAVWSLPFVVKEWHGGMGSNMRYLLALVPVLCALSARLLIDFARSIANAPRILLLGGLAGAIVLGAWTFVAPTHAAGTQQILSTWILAGVSVLALLSGVRWAGQGLVRIACLGAIGAGLVASTSYLASDLWQAQRVRVMAEAYSLATADLPGHTLAYVPAPFISRWTLQPGHITAMPDDGYRFDYALIDQALAKGYRVLVWPGYVTGGLRAQYGPRLVRSGLTTPDGELFEVKPAAGQERS